MKKKEYFTAFFIGFLFFLGGGLKVFAADILEFQQKSGKELILINVSKNEPRKIFTISNPDRLVVDLPSVDKKHNVSLPDDYSGKLIKAARLGQFDQKTSRFVFDLNQMVRVSSVRIEGNKILLEIGGDTKNSSVSMRTKSKVLKTRKSNMPPLIVIDAGHGGVDPGTIGENGTQEKDIVLGYAKALKNKLLQTKKYRVILTRDDDEFIMLRKRVAIARKANASLFISLHADSADEISARGLSVYTVSENASDKEAEALAARENKSDIIGGMDLSDERPDVADILISLAQRETKNNSATLADYLVLNLGDRVRMLPNSHRFAGFAVLKAPDIPSVLIEIGFLSNSQEEKEIKSKHYRDKVVEGVVVGIDAYFRKKGTVGMDTL